MEEEEEEEGEEEGEEGEEGESKKGPLSKKAERKQKEKEKQKQKEKQHKETEEQPSSTASDDAESLSPAARFQAALTEIAVSCEKIIEAPSAGVVRSQGQPSLLSTVLRYLRADDAQLRRLAMLSLLKVFNDILPVASPAGLRRRTTPSTWPRRRRRPVPTSARCASSASSKRASSPATPYLRPGVSL